MQTVKGLANHPSNNFSRIPDYMTAISTLSAGYTVNTYSKPPLYDASKCGNATRHSAVTQQQQKTSALGKPDIDLFIARTDGQPAKVTVPN